MDAMQFWATKLPRMSVAQRSLKWGTYTVSIGLAKVISTFIIHNAMWASHNKELLLGCYRPTMGIRAKIADDQSFFCWCMNIEYHVVAEVVFYNIFISPFTLPYNTLYHFYVGQHILHKWSTCQGFYKHLLSSSVSSLAPPLWKYRSVITNLSEYM